MRVIEKYMSGKNILTGINANANIGKNIKVVPPDKVIEYYRGGSEETDMITSNHPEAWKASTGTYPTLYAFKIYKK